MRVLVGYTNHIPEVQARQSLPGREQKGDDVLAFGAGYAHLRVTPDMRWPDIVAQFSSGWQPDVYIHWSPEYNPIPEGMEAADCLTVGVFGDWNLGGRAMRAVGGHFDVLVADRAGCERLQNMGYAHTLHSLLWAFEPQKHRRLSGLEGSETQTRDIDILMIGNFNHAVQWERAPWLARVAGLSRQYRVVVTSGLYEDAYVQAMNRAKIVFNRSIRGEANMRAYEAPACGALMFYEAGNREIGDIYTAREHCVLYDETNLETLLAYYLAPENEIERERIAHNGWQRVQQHSYAYHFAALLTDLEPLLGVRARQVTSETPAITRQLDLATHWLMTCNVSVYPKIDITLNALVSRGVNKPLDFASPRRLAAGHSDGCLQHPEIIANLHAVLCGEIAHCAASPAYKRQSLTAALRHAQQAIQSAPDYLLARFNLAYLTLAAGDTRQAEKRLQDVAEQLDNGTNEENAAWQLQGATFPRRFDWFDTALEWAYGECAPGSAAWHTRVRALLTCRVHLTLAEIAFGRGQYGDSVRHAERATSAMPTLGEARHAYACALRALGRVEDAIAEYRQTLKSTPFHAAARDELARLYLDVERAGDALALLDEWLAILDGCPVYANLRPNAEQLKRQAQQQIRQQGNAPERGSIKRLLALPDWNRAAEWQPLVRAFARAYAPSDPVVLLLRADPAACLDARALLQKLERFLLAELACAPDALPNITLLTQPLAPADRWKLTYIADAILSEGLPALWRELADARCVPVLSCPELVAAKSAANERE